MPILTPAGLNSKGEKSCIRYTLIYALDSRMESLSSESKPPQEGLNGVVAFTVIG